MQEFESKQAGSEQANGRRAYVAPALVVLRDAETEHRTGLAADGGGGSQNGS